MLQLFKGLRVLMITCFQWLHFASLAEMVIEGTSLEKELESYWKTDLVLVV